MTGILKSSTKTTSSIKNAELVAGELINPLICDGLYLKSKSLFRQHESRGDETVLGRPASRALKLLQLINNRENVETAAAEASQRRAQAWDWAAIQKCPRQPDPAERPVARVVYGPEARGRQGLHRAPALNFPRSLQHVDEISRDSALARRTGPAAHCLDQEGTDDKPTTAPARTVNAGPGTQSDRRLKHEQAQPVKDGARPAQGRGAQGRHRDCLLGNRPPVNTPTPLYEL